jgi:hypothetical protein
MPYQTISKRYSNDFTFTINENNEKTKAAILPEWSPLLSFDGFALQQTIQSDDIL